ncbi:MAG: bifunctional phosphopantothenoylcysteine decarboxylase/phosphopantothenate--cysteine ligase CoaBC [Christensenellaceae bacterium]|jgi:phosphopantothenoylcysteine decarboxylase/phosphopantothenate--cysteine ligase|nr:bifunctional phosphopantothenoylcysteine decarboxylase/phosphopantothenate--cysteine ligase CoaBC [Christensenellaceae bacterium]
MKTVIVCVSGGIAAYKSCELVSRLVKSGYKVKVIMTKNATEFVAPLTFETLSGNKVVFDMFDKNREFEIEHISYAKLADAFVVAPATANVISKLALGITDDMLTTAISATKAPVIICPAMNTNMYLNESNCVNMKILEERGFIFIAPTDGRLACGDTGTGRMAEAVDIFDKVDALLTPKADYRGLTVLVTAGATREPIDGVRYITNRSSGKMGIAIAEAVTERGGNVILVSGFVSVKLPSVYKTLIVSTTNEMYHAVMSNLEQVDIIIKAAAPSDYRVENYSPSKIKADKLTLELVKNIDIASSVGAVKGNKKLIVFAAETENLTINAMKKLESKNADMVVANDVTIEGAGFDHDTNVAELITASGMITVLESMTKKELASVILDTIKEL